MPSVIQPGSACWKLGMPAGSDCVLWNRREMFLRGFIGRGAGSSIHISSSSSNTSSSSRMLCFRFRSDNTTVGIPDSSTSRRMSRDELKDNDWVKGSLVCDDGEPADVGPDPRYPSVTPIVHTVSIRVTWLHDATYSF